MTDVKATETPKPVDLRSEMVQHLRAEDSPAQDGKGAEAQESPVKVAGDEASAEGAEAKDAPSKDGEAAKDEEGTEAEDKPGKPNRYQRLKLREQQAQQEAKTAKKDAHEALLIANAWRAEALALRQEYETALKEAQAVGYKRSPKDDELFETRRKLQELSLREEFAKRQTEESKKEEIAQYHRQQVESFQEQAIATAKKYPGVPPQKILLAYAAMREAGEDASLEDAAETLAAVYMKKQTSAQHAAERKQFQANGSAPKPIRASGGPPPSYPSSKEGMKAFILATER